MWHQLAPFVCGADHFKQMDLPSNSHLTTNSRDQNYEVIFYKTWAHMKTAPRRFLSHGWKSAIFSTFDVQARSRRLSPHHISAVSTWGTAKAKKCPFFHLPCTPLFVMAPTSTCVDCQCDLFPLLGPICL